MVGFYIYETETLVLKILREEALKGFKEVVVSIYQNTSGAEINRLSSELGIDEENDTVTISLSQEDTALFKPGKALIQVNIYYDNTERDVTTMAEIEVKNNLYRRVITDG